MWGRQKHTYVIIVQCAKCYDKGEHERLQENRVRSPNLGRVLEGLGILQLKDDVRAFPL